MEVIKLTLYAVICTCLVCMDPPEVTAGKHLENPKCRTTAVKFENTCEVCTRPEQNGECYPGYKCSDVEADNNDFDCYYTRVRGWNDYSKQYDITAFKPANNSTSPLPLISAVSLYQRNQTDKQVGYPALKVKVNVPYLLYGPGQQNEVPESMRIVFSSVETIEYRDTYYYRHPITRLYRFRNYTPTSYDMELPKQVVFKCLTGLDICGKVRVYNIQLTTYAHSAGLYLELNFTATAYLNETDWYPVIATALLPNNSVYVVFSPTGSKGVSYEIFLVDENGHQKTSVQSFVGSAQKYSCEFSNVEPGTYRAKLLVKHTKGEKPVFTFKSAIFIILGATRPSVSVSTPTTDFVIPVLVIAVSIVIAISLLILLYWQRNNRDIFKFFCSLPINHQERKKKSFLLYMREAERFVPCITCFLNDKLSSMEVLYDKDWEKDQTPPFDLFQVKVKQCSHLLVLWSPSASDCMSNRSTLSSIEINPQCTVQDYFKEAITFSKDLSTKGNLKIVVLYIPGYADMGTVSKNIGEHRKFDLTLHCKQLCKYLTGDKSELNAVNENALQQQIEKMMNQYQQEDKVEVINGDEKVEEKKKNDHECPVHPYIRPPNIPVSPPVNRNIFNDQSQQDGSLPCPIHTRTEWVPPSHIPTYNEYLSNKQNNGHNEYHPHSPTDNGYRPLMQNDSHNEYHLHSPTDNGYHAQSPTGNGYHPHSPTDNGYHPHSPTGNGYHAQSPTGNEYHPLMQNDSHNEYHPQSPTGNGYHPHSPTGNGYHAHSPTDNGYHPHSPTGNGYHAQSPTGNEYHPLMQNDSHNEYHPQSPTGNGYHPHSPTDNEYHPHSPTDNGYHAHSPTDNEYHPHSPTDNEYHPHSPIGNGYHAQSPTGNEYHPHSPTGNEYHPITEDNMTSNPSSTEPLLNSDQGYESNMDNLQHRFFDLCSSDTNTKPECKVQVNIL
ncbi:uncharacterized protein LOC110461242 [Mizuhopecten yessoensis]|uniref:uncharacterized protein LOC110461242 n=1 Tax=Mizuhopecten yessoensis TaxID=6573 RepID=UPI000B45C8FB|nr:uncharacterized protein LOC110461242 [Mizuhopecten yessoensis]